VTLSICLVWSCQVYRGHSAFVSVPRGPAQLANQKSRGGVLASHHHVQTLPGPCVTRAVCPMRSVRVAQNVSQSQRAAVMDCCEPQEDMTPRLTVSREVLRTRTNCPGCGKVITYHALAYRHRCPRMPNTLEGKKQRQLAALHARINARIPAPEPQVIPEPAVA
jgi:hypothetical protein